MAESDGYSVAIPALSSNARLLTEQAGNLTGISGRVVATTPPAGAFGGIAQSTQAATDLANKLRGISQQITQAANTARYLSGRVTTCASAYQRGDSANYDAYCRIGNPTPIPVLSPH